MDPDHKAPPDPGPGFNFQEIAQKLMVSHTGIMLRLFVEELQARGVASETINEAIDAMEIRMADVKKQYESANVVQLMIEERKSNGDS